MDNVLINTNMSNWTTYTDLDDTIEICIDSDSLEDIILDSTYDHLILDLQDVIHQSSEEDMSWCYNIGKQKYIKSVNFYIDGKDINEYDEKLLSVWKK